MRKVWLLALTAADFRFSQAQKNPPHGRVFLFGQSLLWTNLCSLHALLAFFGNEGNGLAFFQAFETVRFDSLEVNEQVVAATLWSDEAEAFLIVEPFYGAGLAIRRGCISRKHDFR